MCVAQKIVLGTKMSLRNKISLGQICHWERRCCCIPCCIKDVAQKKILFSQRGHWEWIEDVTQKMSLRNKIFLHKRFDWEDTCALPNTCTKLHKRCGWRCMNSCQEKWCRYMYQTLLVRPDTTGTKLLQPWLLAGRLTQKQLFHFSHYPAAQV